MIRFAVTGATGLVGENLLLEILKRHLGCLDTISVVCFGRTEGGLTLADRLRQIVTRGWQYLEVAKDDPILEAACAALIPVEYDLRRDDLGLSADGRALLASKDLDHFLHLAALTDFRHKPHVADRLAEVNERGTQRILELTEALSIGSFTFVSSAYSCGLTYGTIAPDLLVDLGRPFQNPYQRSKLRAEITVREFFATRTPRLRVFRPTTVSGRRIEAPLGYVNKYDVYLGWMAFFLRCKMDSMPGATWDEVVSRPVEVAVRIQTNNDVGLNIVPADFTAKVILSAAVEDHDAESYHVVSPRDLPNDIMLTTMLERAGVTGWNFTPDPVEPANDYERAYYATVGGLYTPYLTIPEPHVFDPATMLDLCQAHGITPIGVDTQEGLDLMLDFALKNRFGFQLAI